MPVDLEALARLIDSETHPANPATGVEEAKNPAPDGEKPCRVEYPAPTRHYPAKPGTPPPAGDLSGPVGCLSGEEPDKGFADEDGHKTPLDPPLSGLSGRFSGGSFQVAPTPPPVKREGGRTLAQTWEARLDTARQIRARWFNTPPRPLPLEVLKRVGGVPEIHGLQGCWNMAGNRLPAEDLARLLEAVGEEL